MAGVSTKEIKNRIRSMESTRQITKAMEMVAASKLRRAQAQVLACRPYFNILHTTIQSIVETNRELVSPYLVKRPVKRVAYVVIAGDRGLAGGYNSNILKLTCSEIGEKEALVLPVGRKAVDFFRTRELPVLTDAHAQAENVSLGDCFTMAKSLCKQFVSGEFDELHVAYTRFDSVLSQTPVTVQLLPLVRQSADSKSAEIIYEPDSAAVFEAIVPEYVGGFLYGALRESRAAEQAARQTAMDAATENAGEMIAELRLQFNQARQAAITQEITEIISGS